ncbi:MAG: acetylornithine transaminase [Acidimicrobiales bacterium]|nr:MAG: acetylornithine transaminase [Acidimicrobiales bacterium]
MTSELLSRWAGAIMPTYAPPSLVLVRGEGAVVYDADGNSYLDMFGGIAVNALGHAHPAVVAAVSEQIATLGHVSNLAANQPSIVLAEKLLELAGTPGRVFFCNSGAEANEAALKLSRRHSCGPSGKHNRRRIVAAQGSFHGRTMGALSLTGQPAKQEPFAPLLPEITHVPYGDVTALRSAVTDETAMVILEPILGEGGVIPAPSGYLLAAREITAECGALLALDEIQTGIARTGAWFAFQHEGILPDVLTLAKGLGGGLPIGACVAFGSAADLLQPGQHGTTFGGNPVCCAAGLAVIATISEHDLCDHAKRIGDRLRTGIEALAHPLLTQVRGSGLLLGIVLAAPVANTMEAMLLARGYLVNAVAPNVIRLAPPLILTDEQADNFLEAFAATLSTVEVP